MQVDVRIAPVKSFEGFRGYPTGDKGAPNHGTGHCDIVARLAQLPRESAPSGVSVSHAFILPVFRFPIPTEALRYLAFPLAYV